MSIVSSDLKELRKRRAQEIKKRKNFLPSFVIAMFLWLAVALIVLFVDPNNKWALESFMITFFFANLLTLSLVFGNTRRGLLAALSVVLFTFLRYLGVGNLLNLLLIIGAALAFEFYLSKRYN
jgi:hypothetical protein